VSNSSGPPLPVVTSVAEAAARVAAGERVVVVVAPAQAGEVAGLLAVAGSRAPVLLGHPGDSMALAAAAEMAAELGARGDPGGGEGGGGEGNGGNRVGG
jgi:hypothetical protein